MTQVVILLTMLGIAGLYAVAAWFGPAAMVALLLLLPVVLGQSGLAMWRLVQSRSGRAIDVPAIDRWSKWLTVAYLLGAGVASVVIGQYRDTRVATEPPLAEAERDLVTQCRISPGDSVEAVKAAYGVPYGPQKLERPTLAGAAYQYRFERYGISVFFDDRMLVRSFRFDAPFRGAVQGVLIGDSAEQLRATKGPPVRQFQGLPVASRGGPPVFAAAWVYAPESASFVRYDILNGKVHTILANSCGSDRHAG